MRIRVFIAVFVLAVSGLAHAQAVSKTFRAEQNLTIAPGGSLVLENLTGNIEIVGGDGTMVEATTLTTITAVNAAQLEEGRRQTVTIASGDAKKRVLRTNIAPSRGAWGAIVDWSVRVPRLTNVSVISQTSRQIGIMNVAGNVRVRNFAGKIVVANATANTVIDSVNGSIAFSTPQLGANTTLTSVNGTITASVPDDVNVNWIADTAKGDIRTNLPARGGFDGHTYRATINGQAKRTITTATLMGNIFLLANGAGMTQTRSLRPNSKSAPRQTVPVNNFRFVTNLGDVRVPDIRGNANIFTGAGEVFLPRVGGSCKVTSNGGPLTFGVIGGILEASTKAGDITVDRARRGGTVTTRGGTIRINSMNGAMTLMSGGGDITVRRATAPVHARTNSGDIAIVIDPNSDSETIQAKTDKGNVILHVVANFSAEVDATIVTSDPNGDTFLSDIPGLSISKEQIEGGKTRVRATGRLNNGGEKLVLEATNGDIRITTAPPSAAVSRRAP